MAEVLVVTSKVKAAAKSEDPEIRVSEDAVHGLSKMVEEVVTKSVNIAKERGRKTVKNDDVREAIKQLNE